MTMGTSTSYFLLKNAEDTSLNVIRAGNSNGYIRVFYLEDYHSDNREGIFHLYGHGNGKQLVFEVSNLDYQAASDAVKWCSRYFSNLRMNESPDDPQLISA